MHDFAQPPIGTARRLVGLLLALGAAAQDVVPVPRSAEVDALASRLLDAKDPIARGEAALWLADSGRDQFYEAILTVARDPAPAARQRGILAAGRLGAPGCESFLGRLMLESEPDDADAVIAAFALGQLDDSVPAPAIDTLLRRVQGGSQRRNEAVLCAMLAGLATRPHPSRAAMARDLLYDEANRSEAIKVLAIATLRNAGQAPTPEQALAWLQSGHARVRAAALAAGAADRSCFAQETARLQRVARLDPDPGVRGAALSLLGQRLQVGTLELCERALTSRFAPEAGAAAEVLLALAGNARRQSVEDRALDASLAPEVRAVLLDALPPPLSPPLLLACYDLGQATAVATDLRASAALALARADSVLAAKALLSAFAACADDIAATRLALALHARGDLAALTVALRTSPPAATLPAQLLAVTRVDPVLGVELFLDLVGSGRLRDITVSSTLGALRVARLQSVRPALVSALPAALAALRP